MLLGVLVFNTAPHISIKLIHYHCIIKTIVFGFSSVSSALNAAASTTYDDFFRHRFPHLEENQAKASLVGKGLGKHSCRRGI